MHTAPTRTDDQPGRRPSPYKLASTEEAMPTDSHTPGSRSGLGHAHHPRGWVSRVSLTDVLVIRTVGMIPRSTILIRLALCGHTTPNYITQLPHSHLQTKTNHRATYHQICTRPVNTLTPNLNTH